MMGEPFSDEALDSAARMLRVLLDRPMSGRDRIDALAAVCNATFALKAERPELWARVTTHDRPSGEGCGNLR